MHTVYRYTGSDLSEFQRSYSALVQEEFYDGELKVDSSEVFDISVEKALAYPIALMRIAANVGISFRRTWQHIRANKVGVRVIW